MYFSYPVRISTKESAILIVFVILNTIHLTKMANNDMDISGKDSGVNLHKKHLEEFDNLSPCSNSELDCSTLTYPCINCTASIHCIYGKPTIYQCRALGACKGAHEFNVTAPCRFCYQTEKWEHTCVKKANCESVASPKKYYVTNCTVNEEIICLGSRQFPKKLVCSWTGGTKWSTAFILALTLGGFGADRFYLGHWQEAIGKLFSFGGLGVWTLIDALLIAIHHLGPADGSLYI